MSNKKEQNSEFEYELLDEDEIAEVMNEILANDAGTDAVSGTSTKSLEDVGMLLTDAEMAIADPKLYELTLSDPKKAKRVLANRQFALRSKEKKSKHVAELETSANAVRTESTSLTAQLAFFEQQAEVLTCENTEVQSMVKNMKQEVHILESQNYRLRLDNNYLKNATGQVVPNSGPPGVMHFGVPQNFAFNPQYDSGPCAINQQPRNHPSVMSAQQLRHFQLSQPSHQHPHQPLPQQIIMQQQQQEAQAHVMMQQQQAAQAQTQAMMQQQQQVQLRTSSQVQVMMRSQLQGMQQQQQADQSQPHLMMQQQQAAQSQPHVMMQQQQAPQAQPHVMMQQQLQGMHGTMPTSSRYTYIDPLTLTQQEYCIMGQHILPSHLRQLNCNQALWSEGEAAGGEGAEAAPDDHVDTVANQDAAARPEGDAAG